MNFMHREGALIFDVMSPYLNIRCVRVGARFDLTYVYFVSEEEIPLCCVTVIQQTKSVNHNTLC
jgi:hypothetical protein